MSACMNTAVGGRYRVEVSDATTGELKKDTGWFDNLITNQGLDYLGTMTTGVSNITTCRVGSGTATPVVTDVGLQTPLNGTTYYTWFSNTFTQLPDNVRKFSTTYCYKFDAGAVVGTIREVTVGWGTNNVCAFSRSLLKDTAGNPIEVTVTANDLITIYYELSTYVTTVDTVSTVNIGGNSYTLTIRPLRVTSDMISSWASADASYPGGRALHYVVSANIGDMTWDSTSSIDYSADSATYTTANYVNGSYERLITLNITNGAIVNVRALYLVTSGICMGHWGFIFNTDVVKAANQKLDFTVKMKWGRYVA